MLSACRQEARQIQVRSHHQGDVIPGSYLTKRMGTGSHLHLGPESDSVGDGLHCVGVAPDVEAPKEYPVDAVGLGIEVGQVGDVVGDHADERHRDVSGVIVLEVLVLGDHLPKRGCDGGRRQADG